MVKTPKLRLQKKHIAVILIIALFILPFGIPLMMSDRIERYSGAERAAALEAIQFARSRSIGLDTINDPFPLKFYVEKVEFSPQNSTDNFCNSWFEYPNSSPHDRYSVTVNHRKPFGISGKSLSYHICSSKLR